jgi:hypothetical protein
LATAGAEVTLAVRDINAGKRIAADLTGQTGNHSIAVEAVAGSRRFPK